MMRRVILCIDIGTSSLKASFIDLEGVQLADAALSYRRHGAFSVQPDGAPSDIRYHKADYRRHSGDWEEAFFNALVLLYKQGCDMEIAALCISGNGPTLIPVTKTGEALAPLQWFEHSTQKTPAARSLFLPKAVWFMEEKARDYENTAALFSCPEWLSWKLGAAPYTCLPVPAYTPYYWDAEQCAALGLDSAKFPPFAGLGSIVGQVSAAAEKKYGLRHGTPIVAGGPDFIMAMLGTGVVRPGMVCDRAGTSEGINVCCDGTTPRADKVIPQRSIRVLPHAIAGLGNVSVIIPESGSLFDRYRAETGQANRDYDEMLGEILSERRLRDGPARRGRDVLRVMALQVRRAVETLAGLGFPFDRMTVSGGQAKNPLMSRFKAAISGCALCIPRIKDGELAGNAAAAAYALGEASSLREASERIVKIESVFYP